MNDRTFFKKYGVVYGRIMHLQRYLKSCRIPFDEVSSIIVDGEDFKKGE